MKKNMALIGTLLLLIGVFAIPVLAQEPVELQVEINKLIGEIVERKEGSASVASAFSRNLGVGSSGEQVVRLQEMLVSQGYLSLPEGTALGYFGETTRTALAGWQKSHGINPATGFWGPLSRTKAKGTVTVGGIIQTEVDIEVLQEDISTTGMEGALGVVVVPQEVSPVLSVENDVAKVVNLELSATDSDIRIERMEVNLGADRAIYENAAKIHLMYGDVVLGSRNLDSQTVINNSDGTLKVTIYGMDFVIKQGTTRTFSLALEARHTINAVTEPSTWTITIPVEGVRGVDGTGTNVYAPRDAFSAEFDIVPPLPEDTVVEPSTEVITPALPLSE